MDMPIRQRPTKGQLDLARTIAAGRGSEALAAGPTADYAARSDGFTIDKVQGGGHDDIGP